MALLAFSTVTRPPFDCSLRSNLPEIPQLGAWHFSRSSQRLSRAARSTRHPGPPGPLRLLLPQVVVPLPARLAAPPHTTSAGPHRRSSSLVSCVHGTFRRADSPQRLTAPPSVFCISVRYKCCCIPRGSHGRDSVSRDFASRGRKSIKPRRLKMELRRSSFNHGCQPRKKHLPTFHFAWSPPFWHGLVLRRASAAAGSQRVARRQRKRAMRACRLPCRHARFQ